MAQNFNQPCKRVYLSLKEIEYLVKYLGAKLQCYDTIGFNMDSLQDADYRFCSDLRTKLLNVLNRK